MAGGGRAGRYRSVYQKRRAGSPDAQVVVYDSLVGQGVLSMIPRQARCIDVGKRAGHHTMPQEQINQVLLEEARKGFRVVRLKGGDPFLFGRGGEELELLKENQIPYEVVPGVTSPIAVPAYNGIPVTHRDYTSSLHIITGHNAKTRRMTSISRRWSVQREPWCSDGGHGPFGYLPGASERRNRSADAGGDSSERDNRGAEADCGHGEYAPGRSEKAGHRDAGGDCSGKSL